MPLELTWFAVAERIALTVCVGAAFGLNRSAHGRVAGMRTSILVSLGACLAMLLVNMLLPLSGKSATSFVNIDPMRLPLGVLSGIGFLGAGAIMRRDNFVVGVTTAATIWFLTLVGLCLGAGQIVLGLAAAAVGFLVLVEFNVIEDRVKRERQGTLVIVTARPAPDELEVRAILKEAGFRVVSSGLTVAQAKDCGELRLELCWHARPDETCLPAFVHRLAGHPGVISLDWKPEVN